MTLPTVTSPPSNRNGRILELDGLRALAAITVLVHHLSASWITQYALGLIGVRVFFVLSGYLITGILLDQRGDAQALKSPLPGTVLRFYARRMIRLLPVLYVAVAIATALRLGDARFTWPWDLTYLSNFYAIKINAHPAVTGLFWTLAVEEQFYLVWPWVILLTPRRWLGKLIVAVVVAAPAFRILGWLLRWRWTIIFVSPICAFDALGLGALLMYCERVSPCSLPRLRKFRAVALAIAIPLAELGLWLRPLTLYSIKQNPTWSWAVIPVQFYRQVVTDSMLSLFGFGVLSILRENPAGILASILRWRPLVYLGTISYGIYVYHFPLKAFYDQYLTPRFAPLPAQGSLGYFFLLSTMAVIIAALSWHAMERPIARLKRYLSKANLPTELQNQEPSLAASTRSLPA